MLYLGRINKRSNPAEKQGEGLRHSWGIVGKLNRGGIGSGNVKIVSNVKSETSLIRFEEKSKEPLLIR